MFRLYMTRLVLPFVLVAAMISIPFVWFPDMGAPPGEGPAGIARIPFPGEPAGREGPAPPPEGKSPKSKAEAGRTPFQRLMTLGFALILISVTAGGAMLYGITRRQTVRFRRRFAPKKNREKNDDSPPPA